MNDWKCPICYNKNRNTDKKCWYCRQTEQPKEKEPKTLYKNKDIDYVT